MEILEDSNVMVQFTFIMLTAAFAFLPFYIILDRAPGEKYFFDRSSKKDQTPSLIDLS